MTTQTDMNVVIEGASVPVTRDETGRLFARLPEADGNGYREWHAKTLDILNERIARTTE